MDKNKNNSFQEIWNKIRESKSVLMSLHSRPDGDSLGSCTAMKYVLEKNGIKSRIISRDKMDENFMEMDLVKEVEFVDWEEIKIGDHDLIIFLDNGSLKNFNGGWEENHKFEIPVINIDHHKTNSFYGDLNYVDSEAPSCCNVLVDFFKEIKIEFDKELSKRLLIGICTDSGFFSYGNSLREFVDAAFLVDKGVDYVRDVYNPISGSIPWNMKKLQGIVLNNMKKVKILEKNIAYSIIKREECLNEGIPEEEIRSGIWVMQDIKDIDAVFTLTEISEGIKGSFRSKEFDISKFAEVLGGGGHKKAAAFILKDITLEDAKDKVVEAIKKIGFHLADE